MEKLRELINALYVSYELLRILIFALLISIDILLSIVAWHYGREINLLILFHNGLLVILWTITKSKPPIEEIENE